VAGQARCLTYAGNEIGLGRFGHEMKMISHETQGVELPASLLTSFAESPEETAPILVIFEDRFAVVATTHEMIDGAGELHAQRARHSGAEKISGSRYCQLLEPPPFRPLSFHFRPLSFLDLWGPFIG
jgi:hypothetical protein